MNIIVMRIFITTITSFSSTALSPSSPSSSSSIHIPPRIIIIIITRIIIITTIWGQEKAVQKRCALLFAVWHTTQCFHNTVNTLPHFNNSQYRHRWPSVKYRLPSRSVTATQQYRIITSSHQFSHYHAIIITPSPPSSLACATPHATTLRRPFHHALSLCITPITQQRLNYWSISYSPLMPPSIIFIHFFIFITHCALFITGFTSIIIIYSPCSHIIIFTIV